eukprot:NODE_370_length_9954_cov_0.501776.p2 type:complete len:382 gc:universal NODE_370_length_9954_cov_0.501776:1343-198(-)
MLITMKLWKLFKTLSGIRVEIKGKTDEHLRFVPFILMALNVLFSLFWVLMADFKKAHVYTEKTAGYEFVCQASNLLAHNIMYTMLIIFNVVNYGYAVFLAYVLHVNKISSKLGRYMNYILFNAIFFFALALGFTLPEIFDQTTKRIILSTFIFLATNINFLLLRQEAEKLKNAKSTVKETKYKSGHGVGSNRDIIDRSTLGNLVKLNSAQANDSGIFYDYVEVLSKKFHINLWRRYFLLFNSNDKYMSLHTIKKISSNNDYQLKSDGNVFKLDLCSRPVLIEDLDRKNKIIIHFDNDVDMTIVFSNEEMVRKFKMLMNLCMTNIRAKYTKNGLGNALGGQFGSGSMSNLRSKMLLKTNSLEDVKKSTPSKSIEDLKRTRNL